MRRSLRSRSGADALIGAVVLFVGVPAVLCWAVGWPLPRGLPSTGEISDALANGWRPDGVTLLKAVAVLGWLAWAQLAGSVAVELVAQLRNARRTPALPLAGWCRPLAVRLASGLVAVIGVLSPRVAGAAPAPPPCPVVTVAATTPSAAIQSPPPDTAASATLAAANSTGAAHVVRPGETLWDLAERHLGDPFRWRELYDLNRDRTQPDGRRLTDADLLRPGWNLILPAPPTAVDRAASTPAPPPATVVPPPPPAAPPIAPPAPGGTQPGPDETAATAATTTSPVHSDSDARPVQPAPRPQSHPGGTLVGVGFPALLSGAVLGYLAGLLRHRERWRRPGHRFPRPATHLTEVERQIRRIAQPDAVAFVDAALRHLAVALAEQDAPPAPSVRAVRAGAGGLEVLLAKPWPVAPGRFLPADDGHCWRLDPGAELDELRASALDVPPPLPAVVSVGETPEGSVLVDLEEIGALAVDGDPARVEAVLRSVALEVGTAPWAANVDVCLVGSDSSLDTLERFEVLDPSDALTILRGRVGSPRPAGLALAATGEIPSAPTIAIVTAGALEAADLAAVLALAQPHCGLAVVAAAAPTSATWSLVVDSAGAARLRPLGLDLTHPADPVTAEALSVLLAETATRGTDVPEERFEPVAGNTDGGSEPGEIVPWDDDETAAAPDVPDGQGSSEGRLVETGDDPASENRAAGADAAEVRVLGPVEVTWAGEAPKPQVSELVVYLATHPPVVSADRVRLALWPVDDNDERFGERAPSTFWTLVSKARKALGTDARGDDLLRRTASNGYCLSPAIACDWARFESLRKAAADRPADALPLLRQALGLVRGRPFQDVPSGYYAWVGLERLDSEMEAAVADAAGSLVSAALDAGDVDTARFAVEQGLLAVPGSEALLRASMRVAASAGDGDGVERAFRDARRLARTLDPLGEPEPETRRLYEELRGGKSGPAGEDAV